MKLLFIAAILSAPLSLVPSAGAADFVRIEAQLSTSHDDPKGSEDEIVKKKLTVSLSGSQNLQTATVNVVATFYADDLTAKKLVVEKEVSAQAALEKGRAVVDLPEVAFHYTPAHGKVTGSGRRAKAKRIPASGRRYHGWSVKVMEGDRLLGKASGGGSIQKLQ